MSWRRFTVLLRGLGPHSACATRVQLRRLEEQSGSRVTVVDGGPEHTTSVFTALFGGETQR